MTGHSTIKTGIVCFFILLIVSSCGSSRKIMGLEQGWEVLGEKKVNFLRDKDVIEVQSRTQYTMLRFKAEEKDVHISELKVVFANGDKLEPAIDEEIAAGQWSRDIDLGREGRVINSIEFKYRSIGNILSGRANVVVVGRRFDPYHY